MPLYPIRKLLSLVWLAGSAQRRRKQLKERRELAVPVISIGNLTMGGTGKTPCVLSTAEILRDAGRRPGILTRGYGRGRLQHNLVLPAGAPIEPEHSGDEPQIFIRSGVAPVGIGADRSATGAQLIHEFGVDTLLLDDGFQHWKLKRDADVVLIDALDPLGGGGLFPAGRLREPFSGIARADMVVVTRSEASDLAPAIERAVREWNPAAPIFHASVEPHLWVEHRSGQEVPLDGARLDRAAAFCGLGNPQSFRRTLERLGVDLVDWVEFEDHHKYRPHELTRLAHQFRERRATALLTTEKDAVNLCESCDDLLAPLPLYVLRIGMKIDCSAKFRDELLRRLDRP
jgi:tetraacyldisaccharide 4'-kinase